MRALRRWLGNAYGACRRDSLLSLSAANPFQPVGTMPLDSLDTTDPRSLCMVQACGDRWTDDTHGWRTCSTHAPALTHSASRLGVLDAQVR